MLYIRIKSNKQRSYHRSSYRTQTTHTQHCRKRYHIKSITDRRQPVQIVRRRIFYVNNILTQNRMLTIEWNQLNVLAEYNQTRGLVNSCIQNILYIMSRLNRISFKKINKNSFMSSEITTPRLAGSGKK